MREGGGRILNTEKRQPRGHREEEFEEYGSCSSREEGNEISPSDELAPSVREVDESGEGE